MTAVTVAELRTQQRACDDFVINREKLGLLEAIHARLVRRSAGGLDILSPRTGSSGGHNSRCGNKIRVLWAAGLAVLGADNVWTLTDHGVRQAVYVRGEYAKQNVTAGR